ncbi:hypothetical protein ES703_87195 [subsurface metagenome]
MTLKTTLIPGLAIIVIGLLTALAVSKGIDGAVLMSGLTLIAGVGGFTIGKAMPK